MDSKMVYKLTANVKPLEIYVGADWGGDKETGRFTAGGIIYLYGNPVAWFCQKQGEEEYKTQIYAFKEGLYIINRLQSGKNTATRSLSARVRARAKERACDH